MFEGRTPSPLSGALSQTSVYHRHMTRLSRLPPARSAVMNARDKASPTPSAPIRAGVETSTQVGAGFMFKTVFLCQGREQADVPKGEPCKSVHVRARAPGTLGCNPAGLLGFAPASEHAQRWAPTPPPPAEYPAGYLAGDLSTDSSRTSSQI